MDRTVGAMLGLACGDALGAPIEFMDALTVRRRYGKITDMMAGGAWEAGEWTDDTGLALCVAEGILEARAAPVAAAGRRIIAWATTAKDVGQTVSAALEGFSSSADWGQAARGTPQAGAVEAAGNGSLMRTLPVALAYADAEALLAHSARLSAMTHWDPRAEICCAIYCLWIRELLAGATMAAAWQAALAAARRHVAKNSHPSDTPGTAGLPEDLWSRFEAVAGQRYESLQASGYASYCVECLEAAAWCCLNADGPEMAVLDAVNLAGESDTIGALAGGATGAHWGAEGLPSRWLSKLHQRDRIAETGRRLETLRLETAQP